MADRITGIFLFILSVFYAVTATGYENEFMTDPLGPKAFPIMLAVFLAAFSLVLIFRPDPDIQWHAWRRWRRQIYAIAILIVYCLVLDYLGFIASSIIAVGILSYIMGADIKRAVATGIGASVLLYFIFNNLLNLPLPLGAWFGG